MTIVSELLARHALLRTAENALGEIPEADMNAIVDEEDEIELEIANTASSNVSELAGVIDLVRAVFLVPDCEPSCNLGPLLDRLVVDAVRLSRASAA